MWMWITVFLAMIAVEWMRVKYVAAIQHRQTWRAVILSGVLGLLLYLMVLAVVADPNLIMPTVGGEMLGTFLAMKRKSDG